MTVVSISSHQINPVAVFIPEGSFIGQSAVGDGNVVVMVVGGERPAVVVGHGVAYTGQTRESLHFCCD